MRFPIRPGKVSCAGIVVIMMVLPNSIWKGPSATLAPVSKTSITRQNNAKTGPDSVRRSVKFRKVAR